MKKYTVIEIKEVITQLFDSGNKFIKRGKSDIKYLEKQLEEAKHKMNVLYEAIDIINEEKVHNN